jgi:hypothetical protein
MPFEALSVDRDRASPVRSPSLGGSRMTTKLLPSVTTAPILAAVPALAHAGAAA